MVISTKKKNGSRTKTKTKFGNRKKSLKSRKNRLMCGGKFQKILYPNGPHHKPGERPKMPLPLHVQKIATYPSGVKPNSENIYESVGVSSGLQNRFDLFTPKSKHIFTIPAHAKPLQQPQKPNIQLTPIQTKNMNTMSRIFNEAQSKIGMSSQSILTINRSKMTPTQLRIQETINKNKEIEAKYLREANLKNRKTQNNITSYLNISSKSGYEVPVSKIESTYEPVNKKKSNAEKFANMLNVSTPSKKESTYQKLSEGKRAKPNYESIYARFSNF